MRVWFAMLLWVFVGCGPAGNGSVDPPQPPPVPLQPAPVTDTAVVVVPAPEPPTPIPTPPPRPPPDPNPVPQPVYPVPTPPPSPEPVPHQPAPVDAHPAGTATCDDDRELEPKAMLGRLSPEQAACLEARIADDDRAEHASLLLIANAYSNDKRAWEELTFRHLTEIDDTNADLAYKYAVLQSKKGRVSDVMEWADVALAHSDHWTGDTRSKRVASLHKLKSQAAYDRWMGDPSNEAARREAQRLAAEWYQVAARSGQDTARPLQNCLSAGGTDASCTGTKVLDFGSDPITPEPAPDLEETDEERIRREREEARWRAAAEAAQRAEDDARRRAQEAAALRAAQEAAGSRPVERYPSMTAPSTIAVGRQFTLVVALTTTKRNEVVQKADADLRVAARTSQVVVDEVDTTDDGALQLDLADIPDEESWLIDVVLDAPGFTANEYTAELALPKSGSSKPVVFRLTLDAMPTSGLPMVEAQLYHREGGYLGRIGRVFQVEGAPELASAIPAAPEPETRRREEQRASEPVRLGGNQEVADLEITLTRRDREDSAQITLKRPRMTPDVLSPDPKLHVADRDKQLRSWYADFSSAGRGPVAVGPAPPSRVAPTLKGAGKTLWKVYVPPEVKQAIWDAWDAREGDSASIQIYTDDPSFPWELVVPQRDGEELDFLGVDFRVARWHLSHEGAMPLPPERVKLGELVAMAPAYQGSEALPAQEDELHALERTHGFRRIDGTFSEFARLVQQAPQGIVHFAGHGIVADADGAAPAYAIKLEDGEVGLSTWYGLDKDLRKNHPLIFFNACDVGRAHTFAGFVDGWAPAVLDAGASGYIGGLWPLADQGAARFAARFYEELGERLERDGSVVVADVLRTVRKEFHDNGDPTFLAYVYYGDPNTTLRL